MGFLSFSAEDQVEKSGDQTSRVGEASMDRTLVLSLHKSLGNWKCKVTVQERQGLHKDERFFRKRPTK